MRLPGVVGALVEKDLRVAWRDPRLKALVFTGVIGPLVLLLVLWQGSAGPLRPGLLLAIASFSGLGALGANAFALERQGLGLLFGFPADRLSILVGKNLGVIALRLPALVAVSLATLVVAGPAFVPAVATVVLLTQVLAAAADNYLSILFPVPGGRGRAGPERARLGHAGPRRRRDDPRRDARDARRLGARSCSSPGCPHLLGERWLWALDPAARPRRGGGRPLHGDLGRGAPARAARAGARRPHGGGGLRWPRRPRVAIVGLGLVGGSLARALTAAGYRVTGIDWPLVVRRAARAARAIAAGATRAEAAAAADVVVLAAPPATNLRLLRRLAKVARPGLVITDVSSVKGEIVREAARLGLARLRGRAPDGGHREARLRRVLGGPLPRGRRGGSCPAATARATRLVRAVVRATGARPITTDAATHDRAMAFLSHVPQVVAWALLEAARGDAVARRHLRRAGPGLPRHDPPRPQPAPPVEGHPRREPRRGPPRPRGARAPPRAAEAAAVVVGRRRGSMIGPEEGEPCVTRRRGSPRSPWLSLALLAGACNKGPAEDALEAADQALAAAKPELEKYAPERARARSTSRRAGGPRGAREGPLHRGPEGRAGAAGADPGGARGRDREEGASWWRPGTSCRAACRAWSRRSPRRLAGLAAAKALPKGMTEDRLASAQTDLGSVTQAWTEATAAFQGGDVPKAVRTAQDVKAKADALAGMLGSRPRRAALPPPLESRLAPVRVGPGSPAAACGAPLRYHRRVRAGPGSSP